MRLGWVCLRDLGCGGGWVGGCVGRLGWWVPGWVGGELKVVTSVEGVTCLYMVKGGELFACKAKMGAEVDGDGGK
jgi:hypothetical protein